MYIAGREVGLPLRKVAFVKFVITVELPVHVSDTGGVQLPALQASGAVGCVGCASSWFVLNKMNDKKAIMPFKVTSFMLLGFNGWPINKKILYQMV